MFKAALVGSLVVLGFTGVSYADSTHVCQGNSCNNGTNNHIEGDMVIQGGKGGSASADAKAYATGGKAEAIQINNQKQLYQGSYTGSQNQQQSQSANNAGNQQTINVQGAGYDRYAPPAYAPGLTSAGTGVCLGSVSIGLSGPMAGASFGITKVDKGCERRSGAALLWNMGVTSHEPALQRAAIRILAKDPEIRDSIDPELLAALGIKPEMTPATGATGQVTEAASVVQGGQ